MRDAKLFAAIRANPKNVRFADACRAARLLGFVHEGGRGSHRVFKRQGEPRWLHPALPGAPVGKDDRQIRARNMRYLVEVFWSDEDEGYVAVVPDLPGCSAFGATPEEAVHEIKDAVAAWIEACQAAGEPVPEPSTKARWAA